MNEDKSNYIPKTKGKWLGVIIYTKNLLLTIPKEKIVKLKFSIENDLNDKSFTPKHLTK